MEYGNNKIIGTNHLVDPKEDDVLPKFIVESYQQIASIGQCQSAMELTSAL